MNSISLRVNNNIIRGDVRRSSNVEQIESRIQLEGVIEITNTGMTPVIISQKEAEKTKVEGVSATDFHVGVAVNPTNKKFEAVLIEESSR